MIESNLKKYSKLEHLNVSRETFPILEEFRSMLIYENKKLNLISKSTEQNSINRHIIDTAQITDIIDKNSNICIDLGSGSGLPGIVLAIIFKDKKEFKFKLYEKSSRKSIFLKKVITHFKLNAEVKQKNVFKEKKIHADIVVARAFKPLPVILELIHKKFNNPKELIFFLGRSGNSTLKLSRQKWHFDYEVIKSITDTNSIIVKINNLKKK